GGWWGGGVRLGLRARVAGRTREVCREGSDGRLSCRLSPQGGRRARRKRTRQCDPGSLPQSARPFRESHSLHYASRSRINSMDEHARSGRARDRRFTVAVAEVRPQTQTDRDDEGRAPGGNPRTACNRLRSQPCQAVVSTEYRASVIPEYVICGEGRLFRKANTPRSGPGQKAPLGRPLDAPRLYGTTRLSFSHLRRSGRDVPREGHRELEVREP